MHYASAYQENGLQKAQRNMPSGWHPKLSNPPVCSLADPATTPPVAPTRRPSASIRLADGHRDSSDAACESGGSVESLDLGVVSGKNNLNVQRIRGVNYNPTHLNKNRERSYTGRPTGKYAHSS